MSRTPQNFRSVRVQHCAERGVLPVGLNFRSLFRDFLILAGRFNRVQPRQHPISVIVGVLDDVGSVGSRSVSGVAGGPLNQPLSLAAALLILEALIVQLLHQRGLLLAASQLRLRSGLHDGSPQAVDGVALGVEAVAQALGVAVQLADDRLGISRALWSTASVG